MQKFFAIIVLLCCTAGVCLAGDAPQVWVNAVVMNAMERVLVHCMDNEAVLTCPSF